MTTIDIIADRELSNIELDAVSGGQPVIIQNGSSTTVISDHSIGVSNNGAGFVHNWVTNTLCTTTGGTKNLQCVQL